MRVLFLIFTIFIISCRQIAMEGGGYTDSSNSTVSQDPEIVNLKVRVAALEKQVVALLKNDSLLNVSTKTLATSYKDLIKVFKSDSVQQWRTIHAATDLIPQVASLKKDSIAQWAKINSVTPLIPKVSSLTDRYIKDSVKQWPLINKVQPLLTMPLRFTNDSTFQWRAIRQLQAAAPVTQIPVMQGQISTLQKQNSTSITVEKILQSNIDNMGNRITDSVLSIRKFIDTISVFVDSTEFSNTNRVLRVKALPTILQNISQMKIEIRDLQSNQFPILDRIR